MHNIRGTRDFWLASARCCIHILYYSSAIMIRWLKIVMFLALLNLVCGSEICSCSPLVYRWKIDFSLSCLPVGLNVGPSQGITNFDCDVVGDDASITDLKPIVITSYQLSELDMNLQVFKSEAAQDLSLTTGDVVEFRSETSVNSAFYSGGFQAIFDAKNELGQSIRFTWILVFSNICEVDPFETGQSIGWLSISVRFCSIFHLTYIEGFCEFFSHCKLVIYY